MTDTVASNKNSVIKNALAMFLESTMQLVELRISAQDHAVRSVAIMESLLDIAITEIAKRQEKNSTNA